MNAADHEEAGPGIGRTDGGGWATHEHDQSPAEADASADRSHAADRLGAEALRLDKGDLFRRIARNLDAFRQDSSWARSRSQTEAEGGDPAPAEPDTGESPSAIAALGARVEAMGQSLDALQRSVAPRLAQVQDAELAPLQALVDAVVSEMQRLKRRQPAAPMPTFGAEMGGAPGPLASPMAPPLAGPPSSPSGGPADSARAALAAGSAGPIAETQRVDDPGDAGRRHAGRTTLRRALIGVAWAVPVVLSGAVLVQHYQASFTDTGTATSRPLARPETATPAATIAVAPAASPAAVAPIAPPAPATKTAPPAAPRAAEASAPPASAAALPAPPAPTAPTATSVQRTEAPAPPAAHARSPSGASATALAGSDTKPEPAAGNAPSSGSAPSTPKHQAADGLTPRSWVNWSPTKTPAASPTSPPASGLKVIGPAGSASVAQDVPAVPAAAAPSVVPIASPAAEGSRDGGASSPPLATQRPAAKQPAPTAGASASPASSPAAAPASAPDHPAVAVPPAAGPATAAAPTAVVTGPIQIRTTADAWVQVHDAKGAVVFGRLMRAGESWTVPDRPGLLLTTGNAGGTELVIGGVASAPLGATGVVRHDVPLSGAGRRSLVPASHGGATSG